MVTSSSSVYWLAEPDGEFEMPINPRNQSPSCPKRLAFG
jgi:hypothetical protein